VTAIRDGGQTVLVQKTNYERWQAIAQRSIESFHKRNPLDPGGRTTDELIRSTGLEPDAATRVAFEHFLAQALGAGILKRVEGTWALASHQVDTGGQLGRQVEFVEHYLRQCGMQAPLWSDLVPKAMLQGMDEKKLKQVLRFLMRQNKVYAVEDQYLHAAIVDDCRKKLVAALQKRREGVTVADFRDIIQGNRKICLLLLAIYDAEGTTVRCGDVRRLAAGAND